MKIRDNNVMDGLWPKDLEGGPAPRLLAHAFATLCGGRTADAMYCQRDGVDETSRWRVIALVGASLVEVVGVGDDLWAAQAASRWARSEPQETVEMASCRPFEAAVQAVHVIGTEGVERDPCHWLTRWRIKLDTGDLDLPSKAGFRRLHERDAAEEFALEVLARLHGRTSVQTEHTPTASMA